MSAPTKEAADAMARACAEAMWAGDHATQALDMEIVEMAAGRCAVRMAVTQKMVNGHAMCHGGYIFLLADTAFAYACNSYDHRTVAQHCAVSFIASGKLDDVLTARAEEVSRAGRSGIYDVTVTRADGAVIAEFRGHSRQIKGHLLTPDG